MNEIKETWKPIEGYEDTYEVSNQGRVRNSKRGGRIMTQSKVTNGYLAVSLSRDGKTRSILVHRLVANAFVPNPDNKPQVNHIDGIKSNNTVSNLEWMTAWENHIHACNAGLVPNLGGATPATFLIESRKAKGWTQKDLADVSGVSQNTIQSLEENLYRVQTWGVRTIYKLAKALGVSIEELAGYEKLPNKEE